MRVFQTSKSIIYQLTFFENLGVEGVEGVKLKGVQGAIGAEGEEEHELSDSYDTSVADCVVSGELISDWLGELISWKNKDRYLRATTCAVQENWKH